MTEDDARAEYAALVPELQSSQASIMPHFGEIARMEGVDLRSRVKRWDSVWAKLQRHGDRKK